MAISRALAAGSLALAAAVVALAGCGGGSGSAQQTAGTAAAGAGAGTARASTGASPGATASSTGGGTAGRAAFAWLRPAPAPARGWRHARLPSGAVLSYPASWRAVAGDRGTATAALLGARGRYRGYLNLTPRQGGETLANWPAFRVEHNREEGQTHVVTEAAAHGLRFRDGARGTCVRDAYTTSTHAHYVEVACLVAGRHGSSVIVGAAPPAAWARQASAIERAIGAVES